jgi:hypothetical protein
LYGLAWQCCKCYEVHIKSKHLQRCYKCKHIECKSCTESLGHRILRVKLDAQGKLERLSDFRT